MTDREQEASGLLLCMMALGGLNGGGNMGQNMSFVAMQNAMQANHSALWAMQMQQNSRMVNCQTVNPLCRAMEQSDIVDCFKCQHYDHAAKWCCRYGQGAHEAHLNVCKGSMGKNPPVRVCSTCQYTCDWCFFDPDGDDNWEPKKPPKQEPRQIIVDYGEDVDNAPARIKTLKTLYQEDERGEWVEIGRTQERKRLTLNDLYNLAFPVDPIRDYFEGVCERINEDIEAIDRVEVVPVERVEIVKELDKPKSTSQALADWIWIEKIVVAVCLTLYAILFVVCSFGYSDLVESTIWCVAEFLLLTAMNTVLAILERR